MWVWPVNGTSNCYVILTTKSLSLPCDVVDMIWVWSVSKTIQVTQTCLPQEGMLLINNYVSEFIVYRLTNAFCTIIFKKFELSILAANVQLCIP